MNIGDLKVSLAEVGQEMHALATELFPICRSITGEGIRQTLQSLQGEIPLELSEVPTGTAVFDWTVPKEWNIRDAYVRDKHGERIIDFHRSNLHVVNYSVPIRTRLSLRELKPHLFTAPNHPQAIPYRTSYYKETWGFCLAHRDLLAMEDGDYDVCIDSRLEPGHLTYGEYLIPGETSEEVLFSCHCCHPSLANDNLSGMTLAVALAKRLRDCSLRYSYRFLFIPGTIGAITWLARNDDTAARVRHGLVLTCLGDPGNSTYKKSRRGNADIDRVMIRVLKESGQDHEVMDFSPYGYDERQYCSPGFNLAVGCFMRTPHGQFPEYHTSADNLSFIQPACLGDSFGKVLAAVQILEGNKSYMNLSPKCEPQLGKRGLYGAMGDELMAVLWVLNLSDGKHWLLDIADRADLKFELIKNAADALLHQALLKEMES